MITTIEIKQHRDDVFESGSGKINILIVGSCRCVAYLNYLIRYNQLNSEPFKIYFIEPNNWSWDANDNPVDRDDAIRNLETNERILSVIHSADVFIHEFYESYGMFNTSKNSEKRIYDFGMTPVADILIPNFHDRFILEKDYESVGQPTPDDYIQRGEKAVEGFCDVCRMSSFPEFADVFRDTWREVRYFWRPNHISGAFSMYIFRRMNSKFLNLTLSNAFMEGAKQEDLFRDPHTNVTQRDIDGYGLKWIV